MSGPCEDVARSFAQYLAVAELENIVHLQRKQAVSWDACSGYFAPLRQFTPAISVQSPVFLRRNLSYFDAPTRPALEQRRCVALCELQSPSQLAKCAHRSHSCRALHRVRVTLQHVPAAKASTNGTMLVVALCAEVHGPTGQPALLPLVARVARVPPCTSASHPSSSPDAVTVVLPTTLPCGKMPSDVVLLLLHTGEGQRGFSTKTLSTRPCVCTYAQPCLLLPYPWSSLDQFEHCMPCTA